MHIRRSGLVFNEDAISNVISAVLLMLIFLSVFSSAISVAVPVLGKALASMDMQRSKDILSSLDTTIRRSAQGTLEYRLYRGYLSGEKQQIDMMLTYSSNNSIYKTIRFNSSLLSYKTQGYPSTSISYTPETLLQMQNGSKILYIGVSEIDYDFVPESGYHRIRFDSEWVNSSYTGNFTVYINYHQYNRKRYYFNISRIDVDIRKIKMWDEEWRG